MKVLVLTDVQGNLVALDAVLATPRARATELVVCLGDLASGPRPQETIDRLRSLAAIVVRGNMDEVIAARPTRTRGVATASESPTDDRFADIDAWCAQQISDTDLAWLKALPLVQRVDLGHDRSLLACHGSPRSNEDVIDATTADREVRDMLAQQEPDAVAVGHMHAPMLRRVGESTVVHPGSVGWPAAGPDGLRPLRAEFAIVGATPAGLHVAFDQATVPDADLRRDVLASGMPHAAWWMESWRMA